MAFFDTIQSANPRVAQIYRRLVAASLYYTGQLHTAFEQRVAAKEDVPWRILRYQRIVTPEELVLPPARAQYVRPKTFDSHLRYLQRECIVLPLVDLLQNISSGKPIAPRTVAITFDGGWVDTYLYAYPLLQHYGLPATVFLPTAYIGTNNLFWQDKLLATLLFIEQHGSEFPNLPFLTASDQELVRTISEDPRDYLPKTAQLIDILERRDSETRAAALVYFGTINEQLGGAPINRAFLSWEEVQQMNGGILSFGTHGHGYLRSTEVREEDFAHDLAAAARCMHEQGITPAPAYAYPEGIVNNSSRETLTKLGVTCALTSDWIPPQTSVKVASLYGRVSMFQAAAHSTDTFACRLWGASSLGVTF